MAEINTSKPVSELEVDGVNVQLVGDGAGGGDYNINVTLNDDNTQSLNIVDYENPTENKLAKVVDRTITEINEQDLQGVTSIGVSAFQYCKSLTNIIIPNSVTSIGNSAFNNCQSLINIIIPDSVTSIGNSAFNNCQNLTNITIPDSVTSIGVSAFQHCQSLINITIPNSVTSIDVQLFYNCQNLTNITIPDSVTSIGVSAFEKCISLTNIVIPENVTSIGLIAFNNCTSLTTMTILATTPPTLSNINAISKATTSIYVPDESVSAYQSATNWSNFADKIKPLSEKEDI